MGLVIDNCQMTILIEKVTENCLMKSLIGQATEISIFFMDDYDDSDHKIFCLQTTKIDPFIEVFGQFFVVVSPLP